MQEIIESEHLSQDDMMYVVQEYIKIRKGVEVKISINGAHQMFAIQELSLLLEAFNEACMWLMKNREKW